MNTVSGKIVRHSLACYL